MNFNSIYLILLLIPFVCFSQKWYNYKHNEVVSLQAKYTEKTIIIDGVLSEWDHTEEIALKNILFKNKQNIHKVLALWDKQKLYIAFRIYDDYLYEIPNPDNNNLWNDDGVELYICTKPENAPLNYLSENEFQFSTNINKNISTIRGKPLSEEDSLVIGENRNFKWKGDFQVGITYDGTINDNTDKDCMYIVELTVGWSSVSYIPKIGSRLLADLCVNDRDDRTSFKYWDWANLSIFAQPQKCNKIILTDQNGYITSEKTEYFIYFTLVLFILDLLSFFRLKKQSLLRQIVLRKQEISIPEKKKVAPSDSYTKEIVLQAIRIIEEKFEQNIGIKQLSESLHKSPRQLQRLLKKETGNTFTEIITKRRMEKSKDLLLGSNLSISQIAFNVGIQDASHFNRVFKKHFGATPSEIRSSNV
ncbi:helix-turn-helix domain-containing protein [uncultured Aquimarina sp.]|uniref:helix-turn-helix domain-containing protein n=1 Tax=uncultured Aquimarina sp. TaxID=575652 RepID=UPI0026206917|nr:helix-turn-helix domain-containing protein [uncultured Aquimarina sp.]